MNFTDVVEFDYDFKVPNSMEDKYVPIEENYLSETRLPAIKPRNQPTIPEINKPKNKPIKSFWELISKIHSYQHW